MMTRDELNAELQRLGPWSHKIDLGQGLTTKTKSSAGEPDDHPLGTWKIIERCLPKDLSGQSVLDVGCNAGFYSVESKKRGAAKVVGVDAQRHHVRQARFVAKALGLDIQYQKLSVYDLDPRTIGHFDLTLALGLIYHCKHLVLALEKLFLVTRKLLILETAIIAPEKEGPRLASFMRRLEYETPNLHPLAYLENSPDSKEPVFNWFYPSVNCLKALLRDVGFDQIEVFDVTADERAVLLCRKENEYPDSFYLTYLTAELVLESGPTECAQGTEICFRVRAKNTGLARWLAAGQAGTEKGAVRLTAHILNEKAEELFWYHGGAKLSRDISPGDAESLEIVFQAPSQPGKYLIEFDMLAEHLAWFNDLGSPTLTHELLVQERS